MSFDKLLFKNIENALEGSNYEIIIIPYSDMISIQGKKSSDSTSSPVHFLIKAKEFNIKHLGKEFSEYKQEWITRTNIVDLITLLNPFLNRSARIDKLLLDLDE